MRFFALFLAVATVFAATQTAIAGDAPVRTTQYTISDSPSTTAAVTPVAYRRWGAYYRPYYAPYYAYRPYYTNRPYYAYRYPGYYRPYRPYVYGYPGYYYPGAYGYYPGPNGYYGGGFYW